MKVTYGIVNKDGEHQDTSKTLSGAKIYASKNGFSKVSIRTGSHVSVIAEKIKDKWNFIINTNK